VAWKHPAGDFRRPPTSCAHRLRKPDRTCELLALSVARWAQERGLRPTSPGTASRLRRLPFGAPRPDTLHRARPAVAAVGLERRLPTNQSAFLRIDSNLAAQAGSTCSLFTCIASPRTLLLAASLGRPRQRPTGRLELPRALACRLSTGALRATRKMRLTDFCNRLPSRAPCGLFSSWLRSSSRSTLRCLVAPRASCDARGERWLTLGLSLAATRFGCLPLFLAG